MNALKNDPLSPVGDVLSRISGLLDERLKSAVCNTEKRFHAVLTPLPAEAQAAGQVARPTSCQLEAQLTGIADRLAVSIGHLESINDACAL